MANKINFKSVGTTGQQLVDSIQYPSLTPIGIKTPLRLGSKHGILEMYTNMAETVHDNLRNLILTNHGERLGIYDFGANLRPLTTDYSTQDDFDMAAVSRIKTAASKWMPFVSLSEYESNIEKFTPTSSVGLITILISYSVADINVFDKQLKVNLYVL